MPTSTVTGKKEATRPSYRIKISGTLFSSEEIIKFHTELADRYSRWRQERESAEDEEARARRIVGERDVRNCGPWAKEYGDRFRPPTMGQRLWRGRQRVYRRVWRKIWQWLY